MNPNASTTRHYSVREADPELERLLREEEEIEHHTRHRNSSYAVTAPSRGNCVICIREIEDDMDSIRQFEQYRDSLKKRYNA